MSTVEFTKSVVFQKNTFNILVNGIKKGLVWRLEDDNEWKVDCGEPLVFTITGTQEEMQEEIRNIGHLLEPSKTNSYRPSMEWPHFP